MDLYELFYLLGHGCHYLLCRYRRREKLCWACFIALSYKYNDSMKSSTLFLSSLVFLSNILCSQEVKIFLCNSDILFWHIRLNKIANFNLPSHHNFESHLLAPTGALVVPPLVRALVSKGLTTFSHNLLMLLKISL